MNSARAAIVTTLRNAGNVLDSFVSYHLSIGFGHLYLFFDDAKDPDLPRMAAYPEVTAIAHDANLRDRWRSLPQYPEQSAFIAREVMARQVLNTELAMEMARADGFAWLLHIDADELFYSPFETAAAHFQSLESQPFETVQYMNYEAVPERDEIGDFFREVDLFKVPPHLNRRKVTPDLVHAVRRMPQLNPNFFNFYASGKSAVRLSAPGMRPTGVHHFMGPQKRWEAGHSNRHFVLHYACCGFENFWTKYVTLGRFADQWWQKYDIEKLVGRFHLEARDVVAAGEREAARAFYRNRVSIQDNQSIDELLSLGVLARFSHPRQILSSIGNPDIAA
ncbi:MAG TPA: glycosyltransferase family 2 protein [Micropepsaceae bacterium]|nr:glycosyltransferase family 2 protein [Micropepsaceae bacterium]